MSCSAPLPGGLPDDIRLELGQRADAERIAMMSRTLIEAGLGWSWMPAQIARRIRDPDSIVLVARSELGVVGFAVMRFFDCRAHLLLLAVTPPYQRRGVAQRLLSWLERSARVAGVTRIRLEVRLDNVAAQRFYRACGYRSERVIAGYYSGRENALSMKRELRSPVI